MSKQTPKERLKAILIEEDSNDLFGSRNDRDSSLEEACVEFLLERNYKVLEPLKDDFGVTKLQDLRTLYYALASRKYAGKYVNLGRGSSMDSVIMRNFVNSRMHDGVTRKNALIECANIMKTVFNYSDQLGIEGQISIGMFDPGLFSWVIEKALAFINGQLKFNEEVYVDDLVEKACSTMDFTWAMFEEDSDGKERG